MPGYKGPIEFPVIGVYISASVKQFATKNDCESEAYYHDEPVWFVLRQASPGFFQQVQIAAFLTEEGEHLYFTPFAYVASKDGVKITPCYPDKSFKVSLAELYVKSDPEDVKKTLLGQIQLAWDAARQFNWKEANA